MGSMKIHISGSRANLYSPLNVWLYNIVTHTEHTPNIVRDSKYVWDVRKIELLILLAKKCIGIRSSNKY